MSTNVVEFLKNMDTVLTFTVPQGVTKIRAEAIAPGANGNPGSSSATSKGGSGGAYAMVEMDVTPGQVIEYFVGNTVAFNTPRTITYFGSTSILAVESGINTNNTSNNGGGVVLAGTGFPGGTATNNRRGGGGAGGPNGPGGVGTASGGGGANGGSSSNNLDGGFNRFGTGGGAGAVDGVSPAGTGTNGGGGGGGVGSTATYAPGGQGSQENIWVSTVNGETAGPGGAGGASSGSTTGGNAGGYGAGGGGGRSGATGRHQGSPGIIVLSYTVADKNNFYAYSYIL